MLEDRRVKLLVALVGGALVTVIAQWYVFFDWYWSIVADAVIFVLASLVAYYGVVAVSD